MKKKSFSDKVNEWFKDITSNDEETYYERETPYAKRKMSADIGTNGTEQFRKTVKNSIFEIEDEAKENFKETKSHKKEYINRVDDSINGMKSNIHSEKSRLDDRFEEAKQQAEEEKSLIDNYLKDARKRAQDEKNHIELELKEPITCLEGEKKHIDDRISHIESRVKELKQEIKEDVKRTPTLILL